MKKFTCSSFLLVLIITGTFHALAQDSAFEFARINRLGRGTIIAAELSADGEQIAVAGNQGVWVYDYHFNDLAHLEAGDVQHIAWADDNAYLAVLNRGDVLSIWDMTNYEQVGQVDFPESGENPRRLGVMAWKPNSRLLTLFYNFTFALWNLETSTFEDILPLTIERQPTDIAWSPDGSRLAFAIPGELQIWDSRSSAPPLEVNLLDGEYSGRRISRIAWSPDGVQIAIVDTDGYEYSGDYSNTLRIIDAETGEISIMMQAGLAADAAWSPDGTMIATATADFNRYSISPLRVWDTRTAELLAELHGHTRNAHTIRWLPDGQQILSAAFDNTVHIWQVEPELPVNQARRSHVLGGHMDRVNALAWSPDGAQLVTGTEDGSIRVWDVHTGALIETDYQHDRRGVQALDWSPDGRYLAIGGSENIVHIWGLTDDAAVIHARYLHDMGVNPGVGNPTGIAAVAWSPDSSTLASSGYDATVRLWRLPGHQNPQILRRSGWAALSLAWSADGERVISSGGRFPMAWDAATGEELDFPCGGNSIVATGMSPDGQYLLAGEETGAIFLCDILTGERLPRFSMERILDWNPVYPIAVSARGLTNQEIVLFDPLTIEPAAQNIIYSFAFDAPVRTAKWSDDGRLLAIGLVNGTVEVWQLAG